MRSELEKREVTEPFDDMRYEFKRLDILGAKLGHHPHHNVRHVAMKDAILRCDGQEVLVLGCGKGIVEYLLPDGLRCVSVDINDKEIEAAKEINRYKANREFYVGDIFATERLLADRRFPIVAISEVIEHLREDRQALQVARQHLIPGGCLVLTVPNANRFHNRLLRLLGRAPFLMTPDHAREYTLDGVSRLLTELGFSIVRWRGVWFDFPRSYGVEKYVSPYSKLRSALASLFPRWATYFLFVCKSSESKPEHRRKTSAEISHAF